MVMKQNKQHSLQLRVEAANQDPQCSSCNPCCLLLMDRTSEETTRISKRIIVIILAEKCFAIIANISAVNLLFLGKIGMCKRIYFYFIVITLGKFGQKQ